MSLQSRFLLLPTRRRMGLYFAACGIVFLIASTASPTNYRNDWLDPRWWASLGGWVLLVGGVVAALWPVRGRGR